MTEQNYHTYDMDNLRSLNRELKSLLLSQKILDALKEKQLSRFSFASLMKVQPSIITRWLSGKHNFTIETLFQIEDCLGIKLLAIDIPQMNSVNLHLRVNTNQAVFNDAKVFPNFTSNNLPENQTERLGIASQDLDDYLTQLRIDLEKNGR
ncbi:MAG: helix-turn-helix transcriptional regulator [Bacteroidota bacterium]